MNLIQKHFSPDFTSEAFDTATEIVKKLRSAGFTAYIVGGAVRDMYCGKTPKDFDITTSAVPEEIMTLFEKTIPLGASFGVVTVVCNNMNFEVATYREERDYMDGRRPETLRYSKTPQEDVSRRDFTINALLYDPEEQCILDYTGGMEDLKRGVIRTIGPARQRFSEDYLRMLRAVRFTVRFGFELEYDTAQAIRELAEKLSLLSVERIREELSSMLCGVTPDRSLRLLSELGILKVILPEVEAYRGVEQPPKYHPEGDVFEHTMLMLTHIAVPSPAIAWAVLLHDVGKPATQRFAEDGTPHFYGHEDLGADLTEQIMRRLKFSSTMIQSVTLAVRNHMRFAAVQRMRPNKWRKMIADPNFPLELELHRLDCIGCHGFLDNYIWLLDKITELKNANMTELPQPLLNGNDLLKLGLRPGPLMGRWLNQIRDLQLDGKISGKQQALDLICEWIAKKKIDTTGKD